MTDDPSLPASPSDKDSLTEAWDRYDYLIEHGRFGKTIANARAVVETAVVERERTRDTLGLAAMGADVEHAMTMQARIRALADEWERMTWSPYTNPGTLLRAALASDKEGGQR